MSTSPSRRPNQRIRPDAVLDALVSQQARVAGDVIEIEPHTWALHAVIPVDGDVLIAEFGSPHDALAVLEQLAVIDETSP